MAITSFIPTIWDARLKEALRKSLVYASLVNRDYEGEIKNHGDTVKINTLADITVKDYEDGTDISAESLTTTDTTLSINQQKYFNFQVSDIEAVQAEAPLIDKAMGNAGYQLSDKADVYLAGLLAAGTATTGLGTTAEPLKAATVGAYEILVKMKTVLDKKNVSKLGRWVVVDPEFEALMLLDTRFINAGIEASESRLVNGIVARAAGFDIYVSNNVPNSSNDKYKIIASTNESASYAEQIINTESYRTEKSFKDGVKGLHVYGAKVTHADRVAVATVSYTVTEEAPAA